MQGETESGYRQGLTDATIPKTRIPPYPPNLCTTVIETILASVTLAVCLVLLGRMMLKPRLQQRVDAAVRRAVAACRRSVTSAYRWRSFRREAARAAEEAIRRARGPGPRAGGAWDGDREGNVYKPKSFKRPRKPH